MKRDPRVSLLDVELAGSDIESYISNVEMREYIEDSQLQASVERKFEIVGEALNRLNKEYPEYAERIPDFRKIIDFRNLLIHGYDWVEPERVWKYAQNELPQLRKRVQELLTELGNTEA